MMAVLLGRSCPVKVEKQSLEHRVDVLESRRVIVLDRSIPMTAPRRVR